MKDTPTITIDMDKKCPKCGHKGVCGNGLCMDCGMKNHERSKMARIKKCKDMLKCILTEQEIRECGLELARSNTGVTEKEAEKKQFNDQIKAEISGFEASIAKLSSMIQNGYEYRTVECEMHIIPKEKTIQWVRLDIGEIYKSRPMTQDELQEKLFNEETGD